MADKKCKSKDVTSVTTFRCEREAGHADNHYVYGLNGQVVWLWYNSEGDSE